MQPIATRLALFALLGFALSGCAHNTQSTHTAAEYPDDVKLEAESITLELKDPRTDSDITDGFNRLSVPEDFNAEASKRLEGILSKKGLAYKVVVSVVRCDGAKVDTQTGTKLHIEVGLKFEFRGPDNTVVKHGRGQSWGEVPEEQISDQSVAQTIRETALNAFDQYWADEDTLNNINENIAVYRERRGF
jgi:type IV pilus biogenesis protein CpaD/CtpE